VDAHAQHRLETGQRRKGVVTEEASEAVMLARELREAAAPSTLTEKDLRAQGNRGAESQAAVAVIEEDPAVLGSQVIKEAATKVALYRLWSRRIRGKQVISKFQEIRTNLL
jgi:hypothetical protein